jgi:hypothetical protein
MAGCATNSMLTNAILYAALLPLVVSAAIAFIMRRMRSPLPTIWPVAITGGFLAAQFVLRGQAGFFESLHTFLEPHEAVDWLPHIVLLALGVSILMYLAPAQRPRLIALAAALCVAAPVRLLSGNLAQHWSILGKVAVLVSLAAIFGLVWVLLALDDNERPAILRLPLLILVAVCTAIVVTQSGAFVYGLSSAAFGAAITGAALVFAFRGAASSSGAAAAAGIITFTLGSLVVLGHFYAELSTTNAALLLLSLAATAIPLPAMLRTGPAWQRNTARILFCLLPLAIAVVAVVS